MIAWWPDGDALDHAVAFSCQVTIHQSTISPNCGFQKRPATLSLRNCFIVSTILTRLCRSVKPTSAPPATCLERLPPFVLRPGDDGHGQAPVR